MAILTISRQPYSPGDFIAQKIVEKLNYKLIDKQIINQKINGFQLEFLDELNFLYNEKQPGLIKQLFKNRLVYKCLLESIIFDEASNGNVVIMGRGGNYILNQPFVINTKIIAPFDVRCKTILKKDISDRVFAKKILEKLDQERKKFIEFLFENNISDESTFDLVINCHKLDTEAIITTIIYHLNRTDQLHPLNDSDKYFLKCLSLEKRVEATIKKKASEVVGLKVKCEQLGNITISGYITNDYERNVAIKLANECYGVKSVENDLCTIKMSL